MNFQTVILLLLLGSIMCKPLWTRLQRPSALSCFSSQGNVDVLSANKPENLSNFSSDKNRMLVDDPDSVLLAMYKGSLRVCSMPKFPRCKIMLCGTVHIANFSSIMVENVVSRVKPNFVLIELCAERLDSVLSNDSMHMDNATLMSTIKSGWSERSLKTLASGLFCWMQARAAQSTNSKVGTELRTAVASSRRANAPIVLGDRLYSITIQRIFDELGFWSKFKLALHILYELLVSPVHSIKEFVNNSENNQDFINSEMKQFLKKFPDLARVIITERDSYLAATLAELVTALSAAPSSNHTDDANVAGTMVVVAVVGAGHVPGIARHLESNCENITQEYLAAISSSSKQTTTWPGRGMLSIVPQRRFG